MALRSASASIIKVEPIKLHILSGAELTLVNTMINNDMLPVDSATLSQLQSVSKHAGHERHEVAFRPLAVIILFMSPAMLSQPKI